MYDFFYSISVRPLPSASLSVWFVMMVAMSLYQFYHQPEQVSVLRFATCMSKSQCKDSSIHRAFFSVRFLPP